MQCFYMPYNIYYQRVPLHFRATIEETKKIVRKIDRGQIEIILYQKIEVKKEGERERGTGEKE